MTDKIEQIIGDDFNGVVSVVKSGKVLIKKAYGYSDLPNKRPNKIDTRFATASAGKAFVATAVMKLIEDGKLALDSRIGDILDIDLKAISGDITIRQLLNHTSGIPDYFDESIMDEYAELWTDFPNYKVRTSANLLPLFIDKPMSYAPGERFAYNNTGYVVLGLVIEKVTGVLFDIFLDKAVFKPCGMNDTGYYELDRLPANCANSYIFDEERNEYYTNIYSVDVKGTGAGGCFTTAVDVERFWACLLNGSILGKDTVKQMLSPQAKSEPDEDGDCDVYGYGFWLSDVENGIPFFQGSDPGVSFMSSHDDAGTFICVMSNFGDDVWNIHNEIRDMLHTLTT